MPIEIGTLPAQENQAIRRARITRATQGINPNLPTMEYRRLSSNAANSPEISAPVTVDEIRRVIGEEAATREVAKQKPVTGGDARYLPVENKPFTQEQLDTVREEVRGADTATMPTVQAALKKAGAVNKEGRVPNTTTYAMLDELSNRGIIRKTGVTKNDNPIYSVEPDVSAAGKTAVVGSGTEAEMGAYRKTVSDLKKSIEQKKKDRVGALEQARRAEQDMRLDLEEGKRPDIKQRTDTARGFKLIAQDIEGEISKAEQSLAEVEQRLETGTTARVMPTTESPKKILSEDVVGTDGRLESSQSGRVDALRQTVLNYDEKIAQQKENLKRLESQSKKIDLPTSDLGIIEDIKADIERSQRLRDSAQARLDRPTDRIQTSNPSVDASRANQTSRQATNAERSIPFTERQGRVIAALQKRLKNLNLPDVDLVAKRLVNPDKLSQGQLSEGFFENKGGNRVIALSMEIIDPNKSAQEQFEALRGVMNHEVIHALRDLGLFTNAEFETLVKAASKRKYVAIKDGKPTERDYTYLDRAESMYKDAENYTPEMIREEAVAEMFRDYADGKIKVAGKPRTLFQRIKDFFLGIRKANQDAGLNTVEDIFQGVRSGKIGSRQLGEDARGEFFRRNEQETEDVQLQSMRFSQKTFSPRLNMAPDGAPKTHRLPSQLLIEGNGRKPSVKITQQYGGSNRESNNSSIEQIINDHPDAMMSVEGWTRAMQDALGGDYVPAPPLVGIEYTQSPDKMAEKLKQLTPELRKGVDEGFAYVDKIRSIYDSGQASPRMTMDLFMWGILSRGAGPVQQESAFIDTVDSAYPALEKATREPLTDDDIDMWMTSIASAIPQGSPGKSVTMNVNAAGRLLRAMSQKVGTSNRTVIDIMHEGLSDPNVSAADLREFFMTYTDAAGIDNKVVSFIFLVAGKDDVLVMDRIQSRHLWDDGRYGGANIYDGINGKANDGLSQVMKGPVGNLMTRILENGMRKNVKRAYDLVGRPQDASLGRWHWETWVIEGEQVVSHGTLQAIINGSPIGTSVTEGKTDTFSSGMTYIRGKNAAVAEYPLSDGSVVYMSPERFQEFTQALSKEAQKTKNKTYTQEGSATKIFRKYGNFVNDPDGKVFKVTERADIPWYTRPEVDREALDNLAREYENARPDGGIFTGDERARKSQDASRRGNTDRRYSLGFVATGVRPQSGGNRRGRDQSGTLAPLEGAPNVKGAAGPDENLVSIAEKYARDNGIDLRRQSEFVVVDEDRATRIAEAYEEMQHTPQDPVVKEAFQNLIDQTKSQYDALIDNGYEFTFFDSKTDPYDENPFNAMRDLRANKRMAVYGTYDGYGTEGVTESAVDDNPMLQDTGLVWKDQMGIDRPVTANDLFRAVHDAFGHGLEGSGFRARGEENAWQAHVRLFTGSAIPAITSETRGQNSWLNYGPYGETNRTASLQDTIFAPQKTGLMPAFTWEEGKAGDADPSIMNESATELSAEEQLPANIREDIRRVISDDMIEQPSKKMFSLSPPADPNQIIAAPIKTKDGTNSPIFGTIQERDGSFVPVILRAGFHEEVRGADGRGSGLYHIRQRGHDRELARFSKKKNGDYTDVQAIYDTLDRYKRQGYDDGPDVFVTPQDRTKLILDWDNNRPNKAPPMKLVLTKKNIGSLPVYEVVTFYPDIEKKDRAVVGGRRRYSLGSSANAAQPQGTTQKQIKQKEYAITYANTANFLGRMLGFVVPKDRAQTIADDILVKFQDRMLPVGRMLQELKENGLNIADVFDTYLKEEIYHRKVANEVEERQNTIYKAATDAAKRINVSQQSIEDLKVQSNFFEMALGYAGNPRMALADAYLYASHAKERNAYIQQNKDSNNSKGSGMSDAEADVILRWFSNLDSSNREAIRDFDSAIKRVVEDTNSVRVYGGLIPKSFTETEDGEGTVVNRTDYQSYVPLRGKYDPEGEADTYSGPSRGGLLGVRGREDRIAKGRTEDAGYAIDILATTLNQNQNAVIRAEKNIVGQSLITLFEEKPEETKEYGRILDKLPTVRTQGKDAQGNPIMREVPNLQATLNDPSIFVAKVEGQDTFVKLYDPRIAQAMNGFTGLGSASQYKVVQAMGKINRYLSSINTSLNPEFIITNAIRDIQTGLVNVNQFDEKAITSEVLLGVPKAAKGIYNSIRNNDNSSDWAKKYQAFVKAGGKNATNQVNSISDTMDQLQVLINDVGSAGIAGKKGIVTNSVKKMFQTIEDYNTMAENAIRVSVFDALTNRGFNPERAAQAAGNVTVNFSKGGEYKATANAFYLFYNASIQGSFALLNAATRSKKVRGILGGVAFFGLMQDYLNSAMSPEDEDGKKLYDKIPDYIKEHNIIVMDYFGVLPLERGYLAIPMPYGLNIPHNYGRVMSSMVRGSMTAGQGFNSLAGTTLNTLSPIGDIWQTQEGKVGPMLFDALAFTVMDPFIDVYKNEDFSGKDIYKEGFPGSEIPSSQLYWSTTSPLYTKISQVLNQATGGTPVTSGLIDWSPDVVEYWMDTAFGGIGRFGERVAMLPFQDYVEEGTISEDVVNQIPFARKIFGSITERQDLGVYFNKKEGVEEAIREIKFSQKTRDPARLQQMRTKYSEEIPYIQLVRNVENSRRKISQRINAVKNNSQISEARKKEIVERLQEQNNNLILMASRRMAEL